MECGQSMLEIVNILHFKRAVNWSGDVVREGGGNGGGGDTSRWW